MMSITLLFFSVLTGVIRNVSACFSKFGVFMRNWPACFEKVSFLYAGSYRSVLNLSYECNNSHHLWSVSIENLECFH